MKILITGIHGFVGNNLVDSLKNKHTIYGLDILSPLKKGVVKTFMWNELEVIPSVDAVIHLAGKAHDTNNQIDAQVYFDINTGLTQRIFEWFLTTNATKFVFFSSVKVAADRLEGKILTEEIIPLPKGPYGESKMAAEKYIKQHKTADKFVYILRPCMIHGSGNKGNLNLLYKMVSKGMPWPLGSFENKRSFTSIENLQYIIKQLVEKEIEPGIYNIADDEPLSTNTLIRMIGESQGKKARIWRINSRLITFAAKIGDKFSLPLNSDRLEKLTESYVVSNHKLKKALGIENMPVSSTLGMQKTLSSFDKNILN